MQIEFGGTFLSCIASALIFDYALVKAERASHHVRIQLSAVVLCVLVRMAFFYTGGFYQPLLAFIRWVNLKECRMFDLL